MAKKRNVYRVSGRTPEGRSHLEDLSADGRLLLK
jgi:hypothetical protein